MKGCDINWKPSSIRGCSNAWKMEVRRIGRQFPQSVVIKDIPLLLETGMTQGLAEIIVVYVPERIQLERLIARDGLTMAQARARIASQMSMEEKRNSATIVIDNSHSLEQTRAQTLAIYSQLAARAASTDVSAD